MTRTGDGGDRGWTPSRRIVLQSLAASGVALLPGGAGAAPVRRWWDAPYRIVQTNLREIDVLEDPREIARAVRQFGGTVLVSNIGGIVSFYPSDVPFHHRNPYLKGDFVGEMIAATRAEGLAYVGRFDLSKAMKPAFDAHPDWFMRNRDGSPRVFAGTYQACPNGGWAQEQGLRILSEAFGRYKPDGVFFNLTGYPRTDYAHQEYGICTCANCRRVFREMHGQDLPAIDGHADPAWAKYLDFQDRTSTALARRIEAHVAPLIPGVPILRYDKYKAVGRAEVQRRVNRPGPDWPYQPGESCRLFMARNPGLPFSSASTAHVDYPWRQATESAANHELRFAQILGCGGQLDLYLMGSLKGQDDQSWLPPVSRLFHWAGANAAHYAGMQPAARVAIYHSSATERIGGATPYGAYHGAEMRGLYRALVDSRIPFRFLSDDRVADGSAPVAGAFDVVILANSMAIGAAEAKALEAFVSAGGLLIATGGAATLDREGKPQALSLPFPIDRADAPEATAGWSLDPARGTLAVAGRVPIEGPFFGGALREGARDLLPFAPDQRFGPPEFSYAPTDAPRRALAGVPVLRHGAGHVAYIPWFMGRQYTRDGLAAHQQIVAALIADHAPPARFVLDGRGPVELMQVSRASDGATLLHVLNYAGANHGRYDPPPAIHGLRLGIRGAPPKGVRALVTGRELPRGKVADGMTWYDLPPVGTFEAVLLG